MEALADLVAKVRNDDVERHDEHATAIEQLLQGQMRIAQFTDGLARCGVRQWLAPQPQILRKSLSDSG